MLNWLDLGNMQWRDWDDYVKRYDSSVNRENFGKRVAFWNTCESIGYQYRTGAVDLETVYNVCGAYVIQSWAKFKPIVERYREWEWAKDTYSNWERLADALEKLQGERDRDFKKKTETMWEVQRKSLTQ
jgi:hypothetical protein